MLQKTKRNRQKTGQMGIFVGVFFNEEKLAKETAIQFNFIDILLRSAVRQGEHLLGVFMYWRRPQHIYVFYF